ISDNDSSVCQSVTAMDSILVTYFDTPPREVPAETTQRLLEAGLFFLVFASMFENMGQCSSGRCFGHFSPRQGREVGRVQERCDPIFRAAAGSPPGRLRRVRNGA